MKIDVSQIEGSLSRPSAAEEDDRREEAESDHEAEGSHKEILSPLTD